MGKIITNNPTGYADIRNILNRHKDDFVYKRDLFNIGLKFAHKVSGKGYHPFWKGLYYNPLDRHTPCIFFNTINLGKNPWKVYFETTIPRLGTVPKFFYNIAIRQLVKENCKEIIAISQCAYDLQLDYLSKEYPQYLERIKVKLKVQLPPQQPLIKSYSEKLLPADKIVFTLVGADFFRKGGKEVLQVFEKLIPKHPQLYLNIVSALNYGDYATHTTENDRDEALRIIKKYPNNIQHYPRLSNTEVLELFRNSHIGLLPTWADTFGYSVLEAQAAGCPVITTDVRALPEINNKNVGWVIEVPKLKDGNADIGSREKRIAFSINLQRSLASTITNILGSPQAISLYGERVLTKFFIDN